MRRQYDSDILLLIEYGLERLYRKEGDTLRRYLQIMAHEIAAFSGA